MSVEAASRTREIEPWTELLDGARGGELLVGEAFEHSRAARWRDLPDELHPLLAGALRAAGITRLYEHQREALEAAWRGPTITTTGTASGKSLCFNLPTLEVLLRDARARALYLYPTKALAQDQARALTALGLGDRLRPAIYDGDTPRDARAQIRRRANLILTNPDMLHVGILPNHGAWGELFANLAVVVVDEAHVYRGVFGSHVANVLRRLRRIAAAYGTEPRFLLASATIANPVELAERLTGFDEVALIERDGAPSAGRQIAIWNPPVVDEALGIRRSALSESAELLARLISEGARAICFVRSRKGVELLCRLVALELERLGAAELAEAVAPYRAGYTPAQRREIERRLMAGELAAVITTDALELGIDVGTLDAALVVSFPGTIASLRQMWGRAGRTRRGLALYVAGDDALDQFFARHPDEFLERPVESAILDHESEEIHLAHLLCAAHEGPLTAADGEFFGPRTLAYIERLEGLGELRAKDSGFVLRQRERYPAAEMSLRSASPDSYAIVDVSTGEVIGQTEAARAFSTLHEGAIYLHLARSYHVRELDLDARQALVEPFDGDWYTQPKRETDTLIERLLDRREAFGVTLSFGRVLVTETVLAYQRRQLRDHHEIDLVALDLPPTRFATQALWFELDGPLLDDFPRELLLGSLHAVEHAQIAVLPLLAMCDRWDIGGLSTNAHPQTGGPTIFIHDGHPGGIGITRLAFAHFEQLVGDAHRLISECRCVDGCPSCVQSPKCGNLNEPLSKAGAAELLARIKARAGTTQTALTPRPPEP
ncbi:MAG: DEAD/DEAH box helicase [Solirubrobacteraceae bacterium]